MGDDTIKRLQIYNNKQEQAHNTMIHAKSNNIQNSNKQRIKKQVKHSHSSHHLETKYVHSPSTNKLPPLTQNNNEHQERYKQQQKAKRMRMIKNYSDAELLKILNKKKKKKKKVLCVGIILNHSHSFCFLLLFIS